MEGERGSERKKLKLASLIQKTVDGIVRKDISDPRIGFITFTGVKVSTDMKQVKIYVSCLGSPREQRESFAGLKSSEGYIRHILGTKLDLRFIPEIEFVQDESKAYRVEELLKEIEHERANTETA